MTAENSNLLDRYTKLYGPTVDIKQLAEIFHYTPGHIRNMISSEQLPFKTFKIKGLGGKNTKRLAHTSDVVKYIEQQKHYITN